MGALIAGSPIFRFPADEPGDPSVDAPVPDGLQGARQSMHPDFLTYVPGIQYFYFGNGEIMGAVQYSPDAPEASFFGFTLMNPSKFSRKWSTYLYHPERGFAATKLGVVIDDPGPLAEAKSGMFFGAKGYSVAPENFGSVQWKYVDRVPVVSLRWKAGVCEVEEEFFAPDEGAMIFRRIHVRNATERGVNVTLSLSLYANFGIFDRIFTDEKTGTANALGIAEMKLFALEKNRTVSGRYEVGVPLGTIKSGEEGTATYVYAIDDGEAIVNKRGFGKLWSQTTRYWADKINFVTGNEMMDHLMSVSKTGLRAVLAKDCRMDAGIWMYNMEWVIDHMLAAVGLLRGGFVKEAKAIVEEGLRTRIAPDGRTIESSRTFGYDYTELNQNGTLGYAVWEYYCWTGDIDLIRKHWQKIKVCLDLPLRDFFFDEKVHLLKSRREFWERSDIHGIEEGFEMAYQFWVAFGLEKGAELAQLVGDSASGEEWRRKAEEIKKAFLTDPVYRMIEEGHLIKRRTLDGRWQKSATPPDRKRMPQGSPLATLEDSRVDPDTVEAFPIVYEMIDAQGALSRKTLEWIDSIWSQKWEGGGYPRYNATSEDNPPAPWPLASTMVARAHLEAGHDEKVWRVLEWLSSVPGGKSGSWFERLGQSITPPMPPVGVVGWIWYEIIALCVQHIAGIRPQIDRLVVRPRLLHGLDSLSTTHIIRGTNVHVSIRKGGRESSAVVDGKSVAFDKGMISLPYTKKKSMNIEITLAQS
jgi:hypothetical protein